MNINTVLNNIIPAHESKDPYYNYIVRNGITCKDGFTVSVQASCMHYCYPRKTQKYHTKFELYCDVSNDKDLLEFYYDGTICSCVPKGIVEKLILRHGGIDWNLTPRKEKNNGK